MEEIKAGDIRIGNYLFASDNQIHKVSKFDEHTVWFEKTVNKHGVSCWVTSKITECRPIPLTEDMLLKAGFGKHKMSGYDTHFIYSLFIGGETIGITAIYNADFSIMLHGVARGVKYLHRLQNIIKIVTGTELEINL